MSDGERPEPLPRPMLRAPRWEPPIAFADGPEPYAYVPGRVLVRGDVAARHLDAITGKDNARTDLGGRDDAAEAAWQLVDDVDDVPAVVALMRADGFAAQPDHVLFAHDCDPCCGPHPAETFDALAADPYKPNPYKPNPYKPNPYKPNPYKPNPYKPNPYKPNTLTSSAAPAAAREFPPRSLTGPGEHPRITILDTGLAGGAQCPPLLQDAKAPYRIAGATDLPDAPMGATVGKTAAGDGWLDPVAGHGTFIAGILEQLAPGCPIRVEKVVQPIGYAEESAVYKAINAEAALPPGQRPDIISMSFGAPVLAEAPALRSAIANARLKGIVIVASAGNEGTSEPQYPAAYDNVVAVAAVGPDGPAPWSNYGSWVNACAPGVGLVSSFFADFNGQEPEINTADADRFAGWARWSGTSFAAPVVVAALAREMVLGSCTAADAVRRVIDAPEALRIRCMGTVVRA